MDFRAKGFQRRAVVALAVAAAAPVLLSSGSAFAASTQDTATVHGTVVSNSGVPIAGVDVFAAYSDSDDVATTADPALAVTGADGSFTATVRTAPNVSFFTLKKGWDEKVFVSAQPTANEDVALSPITLDPVGYASYTVRSKAGKPIEAKYIGLKSNDCDQAITAYGAATSPCTSVLSAGATGYTGTAYTGPFALTLAPGTQTLRFEISNPVTKTVRYITKTISVTGGDAYTSTAGGTLAFKADPTGRATVVTKHVRRDHKSSVTVKFPTWTDGASPKLTTTLTVNGAKVKHATVTYSKGASGLRKATVKVPAKYTDAKKLHVTAKVHGTSDYAAVTSTKRTLTAAK